MSSTGYNDADNRYITYEDLDNLDYYRDSIEVIDYYNLYPIGTNIPYVIVNGIAYY